MKMQRAKQAHIQAHLQRAAELLQFGTNPGDMLKLQTVDSNQQMTLWVKVADDALPHKKTDLGGRMAGGAGLHKSRPVKGVQHFLFYSPPVKSPVSQLDIWTA